MLLRLDSGARRLLRLLPREYAYTGAELALLTLVAFQLARLVWAVATPVDPLGAWRPTQPPAPAAAPSDILSTFDPFSRTTAPAGPAAVSSLALVLLGTRVDTVSGRGSAIVQTPDGVQVSFAVGEEIIPGVRLTAVNFDGVTISRGGSPETLFLDQSAPLPSGAATVVTPGSGTPAASTEPAAAVTAQQVAADTAVTPRVVGGAVTGLVLQPRGAGAGFTGAGFQPGDVAVSINGTPVGSIQDPSAFDRLLGSGDASVAVERGGTIQTLRIRTSG